MTRLFRKVKIVLLVLLILVPTVNQPARVHAADNPINLVLGGAGATSWNISNIKPGDNGTQTVTLHNAGTIDGFVTIWLSNVVSIQGPAGRPGRFSDYLTLDVSVPALDTNIHLPVVMSGFPQSVSESNFIRVDPLPAGATTTLVWKWKLPPETGNDIQGNGVSFSINYMLEQMHTPVPTTEPPPGPTPEPGTPPTPTPTPTPTVTPSVPPQALSVVLGGITSTVTIGADGSLAKPLELEDPANNFVLNMDGGTKITGPNGVQLSRIELTAVTGPTKFKLPAGATLLSAIYEITGYSGDTRVSSVIFTPFAVITMNYNPSELPANSLTPYIANYTDAGSIVRLEPPPGSLFEAGKVQGVAFHASLFAVVADLAPPPPPLPASFRLDNLLILPVESTAGQPVSISVDIANDGASQGSYQLYLVIDGIVRAIKDVTLEPKSVITVMFQVANLAPGNHQVRIGGLTGELRIVSIAASPPESPVNWTLTDLSIVTILLAGALISYLVIRRSQKQSKL